VAAGASELLGLEVSIFHFKITSVSRGENRSAVGAAAYRSGERIRDERTGKLYNYSNRTDVPHKEILLPTGLDASRIPWVNDRTQLWNAAEHRDVPRNARTAREYQVSLPDELSAERRRDLVRTFSQELADRYRVAVDLAIHLPREVGDPRNHHAHILMTSREITETGFGAKAGLDTTTGLAPRPGVLVGIAEMKAVRERWATLTNEALREAGLDVRVDHRSLRERGIERKPIHRQYFDIQRERQILRHAFLERIRDSHQMRVQARETAAEEPVAESAVEGIKRRAREKWAKLRAGVVKSRDRGSENEQGKDQSLEQAGVGDDFEL